MSGRRSRRRGATNTTDPVASAQPTHDVNEDGIAHAADDLLWKAIGSICTHGTDDWAMVPCSEEMNDTAKETYAKYLSSDRILSDWIDVGCEEFVECLFEGKKSRTSREAYLNEHFGLHANKPRKKFTVIYFGKGNPTFRCDDANLLLYGRPCFSIEPANTAKAAIKRNGGVLTKAIVDEFISGLKRASKETCVSQTCKALSGIDEKIRKSFALQVIESADKTAVDIRSTSPTPVEGLQSALEQNRRSRRRGATNTTDPVASTQPTAVEDDSDNAVSCSHDTDQFVQSTSDEKEVDEVNRTRASRAVIDDDLDSAVDSHGRDPLRVQTTVEAVAQRVQNLPLVSPGGNDDKEGGDTSSIIASIRSAWPRKSKRTVSLLENNAKDPLTTWDSREKPRSKHLAKESKEIKSMLHAASGACMDDAATILSNVLKKDPELGSAVFDKLGARGLEKFESGALSEYAGKNSSVGERIASSINDYKDDMHSRGSRNREEQQAIDAVNTASLYSANDNAEISKVAGRLKMTRPAKHKAVKAVEKMKARKAAMTATGKRGQIYSHYKRALRKDRKAFPAHPHVHGFCHNNDFSRASKEDTGEYRKVRCYSPITGEIESHTLRRWEDTFTKYAHLYEYWQKSEYAARFKKQYPRLKTIGFKLFRKLLCNCCKFSTHQMCADEAITGLEEARAAIRRACTTKYFKGAIKSCRCDFHSSDISGMILRRGEEIIEASLCPATPRPTLQMNPYPGFESKSDPRVPNLFSFDCINSKCKSCGVEPLLELFRKCPIFCPEVADNSVEEEAEDNSVEEEEEEEEEEEVYLPLDIESESDPDEDKTHSVDGSCIGENFSLDLSDNDASDDDDNSFEDGNTGEINASMVCDWADVNNGGCAFPHPLGSKCGICERATHHMCHAAYEYKIGIDGDGMTRCSKCFSPAVCRKSSAKDVIVEDVEEEDESSESDIDDDTSSGTTEGEDTEEVDEEEAKRKRKEIKHKVLLWKQVTVDRTDRKQKELVHQEMTFVELLKHFEKCLKKARKHYGLYKVVDWNLDLIKHNTKSDHYRLVIYVDYSASAKLRGRRVANSTVDTHAVIEVFIVYDYRTVTEINERGEEVKREVCTKRSHIFIGSSESAGKKNDWQFHIACLRYLVRLYQRKRGDSWPIHEVVIISDRCPTQYLCRQNFLQIAMASTEEDFVVVKHGYTCVSRGKGDHDAEGKVVKDGIARLVLGGKKGTKAWDFYSSVREEFEKSDMNTDEQENHLDERTVSFVVYDQDDFNLRNQGQHEGNIVLANMNIEDDTYPIHSTSKIYGVEALPNFILGSYEDIVDLDVAKEGLYELENKETDLQNNDLFLQEYCEDNPTPSEKARHDFLQIEGGLATDGDKLIADSLESQTPKFESEYFEEFVRRCGKLKASKKVKTNSKWVDAWLQASPIERLFIHRTQTQLMELHAWVFPSADRSPNGKRKIVGEILGIDLPTPPTRAKTARELYRNSRRDEMKEENPGKSEKQINSILDNEFKMLDEEYSHFWEVKAIDDKQRYDDEMKELWSVPDEVKFYLRVSQLMCGCNQCLSNNPDSCESPFKDEMRSRIVQMRLKKKEIESTDNDESIEEHC
eukprot:scaffold2453_cov76-Skeletonema_menzelii.AAC.1